MTIEFTVLISICTGVFGFMLNYLNHRRADKKAVADEAKADGVILTEIGYIKSGVDDIKRKQDKQDERYTEMSERLVKVEASAKQAHRRLDGLEDKKSG